MKVACDNEEENKGRKTTKNQESENRKPERTEARSTNKNPRRVNAQHTDASRGKGAPFFWEGLRVTKNGGGGGGGGGSKYLEIRGGGLGQRPQPKHQ